MKILSGSEEQEALKVLKKAAELAKKSSCFRSKCASIIINEGEVIAEGFNSPPQNKVLEKCLKDDLSKEFKSDRTCCVHAEQRAIMNALEKDAEKLRGARLYFIRIDEDNNMLKAGKPYCTICSKMALDAGLAEFVLFHKEGITVYETEEYNKLSFQYKE